MTMRYHAILFFFFLDTKKEATVACWCCLLCPNNTIEEDDGALSSCSSSSSQTQKRQNKQKNNNKKTNRREKAYFQAPLLPSHFWLSLLPFYFKRFLLASSQEKVNQMISNQFWKYGNINKCQAVKKLERLWMNRW